MASAARPNALNCQPLTSANHARCCTAANWQTLVRPQDATLCRRPNQSLTSAARSFGSSSNNPDNPNNPPPGGKGFNNGYGNGDQDPPGKSGPRNNAENANPQNNNPSNSPNSAN
jgi:hypothetical protein